jgi:uncharacterized protein YecT (DUF1311 family)
MRIASLILVAFGSAVQLSAVGAGPSANNLLDECYAYSEAGIRQCLAKNLQKTATALNAAEQKALAALSKWDEEAKYVAAAKEKLRASNAAFAQYREAQCAFAYSLGGGAIGNALDIRRLACAIEQNSKRIAELAAAVSRVPSK